MNEENGIKFRKVKLLIIRKSVFFCFLDFFLPPFQVSWCSHHNIYQYWFICVMIFGTLRVRGATAEEISPNSLLVARRVVADTFERQRPHEAASRAKLEKDLAAQQQLLAAKTDEWDQEKRRLRTHAPCNRTECMITFLHESISLGENAKWVCCCMFLNVMAGKPPQCSAMLSGHISFFKRFLNLTNKRYRPKRAKVKKALWSHFTYRSKFLNHTFQRLLRSLRPLFWFIPRLVAVQL